MIDYLKNKAIYSHAENNFCIFRNLRFSAYRSCYFWIFGQRSPSGQFRTALPSCLVAAIRKKYPNPDPNDGYAGFKQKLPSMTKSV